MEQVDARDLEAALSELDTWTFELENETTVQKRIDWLDKVGQAPICCVHDALID